MTVLVCKKEHTFVEFVEHFFATVGKDLFAALALEGKLHHLLALIP